MALMKPISLILVLVGAVNAHAQYRIDVTAEHERLSDPFVREGDGVICGVSWREGYKPPPLTLELTVVSLNPTDLMQGDKVSLEVVVKNIGKEPIAIPWSVIGPNQLASCPVEQRLSITFDAPRASSPRPQLVAGTMLFGFPFDQSLLPLHPGETANIRADWWVHLEDPPQEPRDIELTPRLVLFKGGYPSEEVVAEPIKVRLQPRPSRLPARP